MLSEILHLRNIEADLDDTHLDLDDTNFLKQISLCACKILSNSVQVCGCYCYMFRASLHLDIQKL